MLGKSPNEISGILTTKLFSVNTAQDDVLLSARWNLRLTGVFFVWIGGGQKTNITTFQPEGYEFELSNRQSNSLHGRSPLAAAPFLKIMHIVVSLVMELKDKGWHGINLINILPAAFFSPIPTSSVKLAPDGLLLYYPSRSTTHRTPTIDLVAGMTRPRI